MEARKLRKSYPSETGRALAQAILQEYQPHSVAEIQDALKDIFGPIFEAMLQGEMDTHLGYTAHNRNAKSTDNRRNGYGHKSVKTSSGNVEIAVPRDRNSTFEPQIIPKHSRDVSGIEDKVLAMYARGMSERDIADTIEDIYGFEISHESISNITDRVLASAEEWQNRPLKKCYVFLFVDCLYVPIRKNGESKNHAVHVILGYDVKGVKDILGIWINEAEGKHYWMQIFDELKSRGVEDVFFLCTDGVSGLEDGARSIFKDVTVQRCIVHLIRNSLSYVASRDYKAFTAQLKKIYGAINLKTAQAEFEKFKEDWKACRGAVAVWERNWQYVEQLFNYSSAVRKVMYTTNAIEGVNASFRKVTKKGTFPNEEAVIKVLYLRVMELYKKWTGRCVPNWAQVRNQLAMDDGLQARLLKYENAV